jgi:putative DNA primase/helicase
MDSPNLTDMGNAERLKNFYEGKALHLSEKGRFIVWDEQVGWREEDKYQLVKPVLQDLHREAAECNDAERRGKIAQHALNSESTQAQRNMLELSASYMGVSIDKFDVNPTLINCKNGIVNLKERRFFNHAPEHLHLNMANASYYPDTKCPRWEKFLDDVFERDKELIAAMQVYLGYSILGLTTEHLFFLCYGVGRNGKSTLLETVRHVLGDYGGKSMFDTFLQKDKSSDVRGMEAVGRLKGKRFVIASETNDHTKFDAARIKELTGGDTLVGTVLHKSQFSFSPTHTLWLACNHRPKINDNSIAMWERVRMIPFQRIFVDDEQDPKLSEHLKSETDGIFRWLVDGAYKYLEEGIGKVPKACQEATQDYKESNDVLFMFINRCLKKDVSSSIEMMKAYDEYGAWVLLEKMPETISYKEFSRKIIETGIKKKKSNKGLVLDGVRLVSAPVVKDNADVPPE